MCGIACFWAKESVLGAKEYKTLIQGTMLRGQDGLGICIYNGKDKTVRVKKYLHPIHKMDQILGFIEDEMGIKDVLFVISRATPETEIMSSDCNLQPIVRDDLILIHNGGVVDSLRSRYSDLRTWIDSEMILSAYESHGRNLKSAMQNLVGSFAFCMIDSSKNKLYEVTSFNPLAHMYLRGSGYFVHSDNEVLAGVLQGMTGQTLDGVSVWESWYHHYVEGYTIIETDLESGFQFKTKYIPKFLHPTWDLSSKKGTKTLVVCSGGIDSGLSAWILKSINRDVELVHFTYGQKAQAAEEWAVYSLGERMGVQVKQIDLHQFYELLGEKSMLTSVDVKVTSGGSDLKSTIAWVSGRNAIFASMTMAMAESYILQNKVSSVDISAGWYQLSEETGGYPDNSFQFDQSIRALSRYGYIAGHHIDFLPLLQRLTKTEEWKLGQALDFPFELTVSCDDPVMDGEFPRLCTTCGSTKLSILASDRAGVKDKRLFIGDRPTLSEKMETPSVNSIIDRLVLPVVDKEKLYGLCR